ncbi:hypothetical protein [Aliiglaciecola sp. LCG003]|uniref:hypothetical protein n=1 Tax=Aliiglaciecola sp. LCG003 TaxID=3053655 RepID=UPI002574456B|nr:hypothetical protein [Aliiglaciecola sp. LCG003]WJG07912.1 hypothetical protein QR722_11115 [Aliiglaciecola sp. LCG003]
MNAPVPAALLLTTMLLKIPTVEANELSHVNQLPLSCEPIPQHKQKLCVASTHSKLNAVNDVVFYHSDQGDNLTLLHVRKGDVAVTWLEGFSLGGRYTIIGEAEEGHPSYLIYDTEQFIDTEYDPKPVAVISDYLFSGLNSLTDAGIATMSLNHSISCEPDNLPKISPLDSAECKVTIDIFKPTF